MILRSGLLLIVLFVPGLAAPQQPEQPYDHSKPRLQPGSTVVSASMPAPIREAPPHGYLKWPGRKLDTTVVENEYIILELTTLPYMFSEQIWVKIGNAGDEQGGHALGWVYWGKTDDSSENFTDPVVGGN